MQLTLDLSVDDDDRAQHSKSTAHHHDRMQAKRIPSTESGTGSEGPEAMLRHTHSNKDRAQAAAKGRQSELDRKEKHLTATITGNTGVMAGMQLTVQVGAEMYDDDYSLKTVKHKLTKGGGLRDPAGGPQRQKQGGQRGQWHQGLVKRPSNAV